MLRLRPHVDRLVLRIRFVFPGADIDAEIAAGTVFRSNLNRVFLSFVVVSLVIHRLERIRRAFEGLRVEGLGPYRRVRADECALVALDTELRIPDWNLESDVSPFPLRRAGGPCAVRSECADGKQIALPRHHHGGDALNEIGRLRRYERRGNAGRRRLDRELHFVKVLERKVDRGPVAPHHLISLLRVCLLDRLLDLRDRLFTWKHSREGEKARLHDRVDPAAHPRRRCDG